MIISESIVINAPLRKVWHTFTDLACWKDWSTVVSNVSSDTGHMTEGRSIFGRAESSVSYFDYIEIYR